MPSADAPLWDNPLGTDGFEFVEYAAPETEYTATGKARWRRNWPCTVA